MSGEDIAEAFKLLEARERIGLAALKWYEHKIDDDELRRIITDECDKAFSETEVKS